MSKASFSVKVSVHKDASIGWVHEVEFPGYKPALLTTAEMMQCIGEYISNETLPGYMRPEVKEDQKEVKP